MPRARYSRWDGSQEADELDADDVFRRLCDDLAQHGDLDQALRRVMQQGFLGSSGRQVAGLRELLERVRQRRAELTRDAFSQLQAAISAAPPEALRRARGMLADLNSLVERQRAGEDVQADFEQLSHRYADLLPGDPSTLDELLETLASQMAAMRELLGSMTPEQRAKLAELSEAMLEAHPGLSRELERLASNLAGGALAEGASTAGNPTGVVLPPGLVGASGLPGPFGTEATSFVGQVTDLGQLEQLLSAAPNPGALAEVDIDRARELLGAEDARSLEALGRLGRELRRAGLAEQKEGRLRLTPRGLRRIGEQALNELYTRLARSKAGQHPAERQGPGHERAGETKPYEWGDPFNLSIERTLRNAVARRGPGLPVELAPEDFDVERTEALSRSATVIMLDLSLSMPMRGNFLAAKKVAMALHALISSKFPSDYLGVVGFSRYAREISFRTLPEVSWDYDWGTNIQHGLLVARSLLSHQSGTRQVIMVTDGEPTAHWPPGAAEPVFAYPPARETVDATLAEVARCGREGIRVNTFALDATGHLRRFVEQLARLNKGKAFFASSETLGEYVLLDFLEPRRSARRLGSQRRP